MRSPYGQPPFHLPQQLPEAAVLTGVMTIKMAQTEPVFMIEKTRLVSQATDLASWGCIESFMLTDTACPGAVAAAPDKRKHAKGWGCAPETQIHLPLLESTSESTETCRY